MENKEISILSIDDVLPNRFQPRIKFDEKAINELSESIKIHGVIQPIVVRKISDKYEIIAGERRYKASVLAGKKTIPAIVTSLDDKESAEIALIENVQRQNLTPIEEAISYKKILDMGYLNQISLGEKLGKTQSTIANKLRLLNLNEDVQESLMEGKISERHARSLLRLKDSLQPVMLARIITERLTVRKTDEEIEKLLNTDDSSSNEQKEIERVDNMNNDLVKEFNIPMEPIVEEPNKEEISNIETIEFDIPVINNEFVEESRKIDEIPNIVPFKEINPGFMDVEKIEKEAEDIYKEPAPIADMDSLLDTSKNPVINDYVSQMQEAPVNIEETNPYNVPGGGKFFNMFNREEDKNPNYVSDIESKEVNMDFGEVKIEPTFNFNDNLTNNNVYDNSISSFDKVEEEIKIPDVIPFDEPISNNFQMENTIKPVEQPLEPVLETNNENNINSNFFNQTFGTSVEEKEPEIEKTMDFTQILSPFSLNDDDSFTTEKVEYKEEPKIDSFIKSSISPITYDEMGEIEVRLPEQNQKLATTDLKTVINTIRECAATIEKFGFTIDTEEIDFEDNYQVTFKIDKK